MLTQGIKSSKRTSKTYLLALAVAAALGAHLARPVHGGTFTWTGATNATWDTSSNDWSGAGSIWSNGNAAIFNATGAGTITLGTTAINPTTITFNNAGYTLTGGTLTLASGADVDNITVSSGVSATIASTIANLTTLGHIDMGGTGTLILSGNNTYTGQTTIDGGGVLSISSLAAINGSSSGYVAIQGGSTLQYTGAGSETRTGALYWNSGNGIINITQSTANLIFNITGGDRSTGTLTKAGAGTLTLTQSSAVNSLHNNALTINGGTLVFNENNAGAIDRFASTVTGAAGTVISVTGTGYIGNESLTANWGSNLASLNIGSGAAFDLRGQSITIDALTGFGNMDNSYANGTDILTVGANNGSGTFGGMIQQIGPAVLGTTGSPITALTKVGTGTQTLSGNNTYSGLTTVSAGTLILSGTNSLGRIDVNNAGVLQVTGGSTSLSNYFTLDTNGSGASYNQTGGTVTIASGFGTYLSNVASGVTTFTMNGGTFTASSGGATEGFHVGRNADATVIISGTAILHMGNQFDTGFTAASGTGLSTYTQTGGTVDYGTGNAFIASSLGTTASLNISGGSFTGGSIFYLGVRGNSTLNLSNTATMTLTSLSLGFGSGGGGGAGATSDTVTLGDGTNFTSGSSILTGTSGVLIVGTVGKDLGSGTGDTATFNFNGGTLKASGNNSTFFQGLNTASVQTVGGIIDNGGFGVTIGQALLHGSGTPDGGLKFQGSGTTTLNAANTYTGNTIIHAGKVVLTSTGSINNSAVIDIGDTGSSGTVLDVSAHASGFTVGSSQTLQGIGTLVTGTGTAKTTNNGILAPGNSIGTLNVTGDYAFGATENYQVQIDDTQTQKADRINISGAATIVSGSLVTFSVTGTAAQGNYILATAASGLGSPAFTTDGTLPSGYRLLQTATELDLTHKADQAAGGFTYSAPTGTPRALVSTSVALNGTLTNTAPSGSSALAVALTSTGTLAVTSLNSSTGATVNVGSPSTITGSIGTGVTAGTIGWQVTNTDSNAVTTTANISGSIDVVNQRTFNVGTTPIALGRFLITGTPSGTTAISSTGLNNVIANATLGSFAGTNTDGLTLTTGDSTVFNGGVSTQTANYAIGGLASTAGAISGSFSSTVTAELGSIAPVTVTLTGTAVNERTYTSPGTINFGNLLFGASVSSAQTISTSGLHAVTADATLSSSTSGTINGVSLTGGSDFINGTSSPVNLTRTITGAFNTGTFGTQFGTFNMNSVDEFSNTITDAASVSYTVNAGAATTAHSDRDGIDTADRLAYQLTKTSLTQTLFNAPALTASVAIGGSYAGLASKTVYTQDGSEALGTVATILAGSHMTGGSNPNTVSMTWRDRSTLERPGGSSPPLPASVGSQRYLISDVVLLTGMNGGEGQSYVDTKSIGGQNYSVTNYETDLFALQMSYSGGANPTLDWLNPADSTWELANTGDFTGEEGITNASGGELDFIGSFASFQTTYGPTLSAYLGAYGYDPTTSVAWAVINHNSQFAVMGEVPEPTSLGLLGLGALGLLSRRSRKNRV